MFFLVLGAIGAALLFLFFGSDNGMVGSMPEGDFARMVYLGIWGTVLAAGVLASRQRFGAMIKQGLIWLVIILALVTGYEYRYELQEVAGRVGLGLVPGRAVSSIDENGELAVTIGRSGTHFETSGEVNGSRQPFIVDTGASTIVLTESNAERAGYDIDRLNYTVPVSTANGMAMAARIDGLQITVGEITRTNLTGLVAPSSQLSENLLGMNFLDTLTSFEVSRNRMTLRD